MKINAGDYVIYKGLLWYVRGKYFNECDLIAEDGKSVTIADDIECSIATPRDLVKWRLKKSKLIKVKLNPTIINGFIYAPYIPLQNTPIVINLYLKPDFSTVYWFKNDAIQLMHSIDNRNTYQAKSLDGKRHYVVSSYNLKIVDPRDMVQWRMKYDKKFKNNKKGNK
jgi:hypothetical protein